GKRCQLEISIALMGLGHAAQQHLDTGCVQLDHGGEIKDELGTVHAEKRLDLLPKLSCRTGINPLGHALDDNRSANRLHIFSLPPGAMETRSPHCSRERSPGLPQSVPKPRHGQVRLSWPRAEASGSGTALVRAKTTHLPRR